MRLILNRNSEPIRLIAPPDDSSLSRGRLKFNVTESQQWISKKNSAPITLTKCEKII